MSLAHVEVREAGAAATAAPARRRLRSGLRELLLLAVLYGVYSGVRLVASDDLGPALGHAHHLLDLEQLLHLDVEHWLNDAFHIHRSVEVAAGFYYAAAHYLVTPAVLVWLWLRRPVQYAGARRALVAATVVALAVYVLLPTAPPRLVGGYHDLLALTADVGWWSTSASAPQGLGGLTNELAAMPSMHVGWALWCALAITAASRSLLLRAAGWTHAVLTVLVVVGTGNHWLLDAVAGAAIVAVAWAACRPQRPDVRAGVDRSERLES